MQGTLASGRYLLFIYCTMNLSFSVLVAAAHHTAYAHVICDEMAASAQVRGTGIAKRSPEYLIQKILEGKAVIAFSTEGVWAGFCYIESWSHGAYVANSGLIVAPQFRKSGLARAIKQKIFELSVALYPKAKIFGLTTGLAVMKINSSLGYKPVTYSELTQDDIFWDNCRSCVNYPILMSKERKNCLCTAMLFDPEEQHVSAPLIQKKRPVKKFGSWQLLIKKNKSFHKHSLIQHEKSSISL